MKKTYIGASLALLGISGLAILWFWLGLPQDHWHRGDATMVLIPAFFWAIGAWLVLRLVGLPWLAPNRAEIDAMGMVPYKFALGLALMFAISVLGLVYVFWAGDFPLRRALPFFIVFFQLYVANMFGKLRRNHFLGISNAWTLSDAANWYATHRFAAKSGMFAGLICLILALWDTPVMWLASVVIGFSMLNHVYSFWYFKKPPRAAGSGGEGTLPGTARKPGAQCSVQGTERDLHSHCSQNKSGGKES